MTVLRKILACTGLAVALAGSSAASQSKDDPLLRPVAPDSAARWLTPQKPARIFGNTYLVGFGGLNVGLIRTDAGLILIDGALPQAVPAIEANIRQLGFRLRDVKLILSTEPHFDHAGGLAALSRDTGAPVLAGAAAVQVLRQGRTDAGDPQAAWLAEFPAVRNVRAVRPGEKLRLGRTVITAVATPGHTAGSTSWSWRSCEAGRCLDMVFASSLNPIAADGWRFSDPAHSMNVTAFRHSFTTLRGLPCGILLTAHPDQSGGDVKFRALETGASPNPFIDPRACRDYADKYERLLAERLDKERSEAPR